jgi:hypothetical protein
VIRGGRTVRGPERLLHAAGRTVVSVKVPRRKARATLRLTGSGAPGAVRTVVRSVRLAG